MLKLIHPIAGACAILLIATFWAATAYSELFGSPESVRLVKTAIPWGFLFLVPSLAATGGTGLKLAKGRRSGLIGTKLRRMPVIAGNGVLVLIPAALFLSHKANAGEYDAAFYSVQAIELAVGALNVTLLILNMRDGFKLSGRLRKR